MNAIGEDLYDGIAAMVFSVDDGRVITSVNTAVEAQLGFRRGDLVGTPLDDIVHTASPGNHTIRTADGGRLGALIAEAPPAVDGRVVVTAIAAPGEADTRHNAKLAALGELAHHVVHELNQPLSVIRMAIGTTRRKLAAAGDIDAAFIDGKLERIDSQCVRAAAIVEYMRVFVPRSRQVRVRLDVNRAVDNAVGMSMPRFRKINAGIETTPGPARYVLGNEMHLEPALLCVLDEIHQRIAAAGLGRRAGVAIRTAPLGEGRVEIVLSDAAGAPAASTQVAQSSATPGISLARELAAELGGELEAVAGSSGMVYRFGLPVAADPST